jgi:hypothetical protein
LPATGLCVRFELDLGQGHYHDVVDADPVAACVKEIMATRSVWTGSATDLLRAGAGLTDDGVPRANAAWPINPRALVGRLRRAQGRGHRHCLQS